MPFVEGKFMFILYNLFFNTRTLVTPKYIGTLANSEDPHEMPHNATMFADKGNLKETKSATMNIF